MKKNRFFRLLAAALAACSLLGVMAAPSLAVSAEDSVEVASPRAQTSHLENIVVTVFWPPNPNVLDIEEQFRLMADFGVTEVFGAGNGCDTPEIQAKFLDLAEKHGMTLIVSDGTFGDTALELTAEEIAANVAKYADNPVVTGFHLRDEPMNALDYLDAYKAIREAAPHLDGHINFFPIPVEHIGTAEKFATLLGEWASTTNSVSDNPTWLMYDYYPFESGKDFDYGSYFMHLDSLRRVGLQNDTPTANYLQGCGSPAPNEAQNRYNVYSSLAYGLKKLSYFLWTYYEGHGSVVSYTGVPSELYYNGSVVNHEALALGTILAKSDAIDVYMTQTQYESTELLPVDYILSVSEGKNADMILSRFVHKETGRNYIMLVNNDMTAEQSITFTVDEDIESLEIVSKTDGTLSPFAGENGTYTVTLAAGDGILLALPETYVCPVDMARANADLGNSNLATIAKISVTSSIGDRGWFVSAMTDGIKNRALGWSSHNDPTPVITLDFKDTFSLNTLNLCRAGKGNYLPADSVISVSMDGKTWTEVATVTDFRVDAVEDKTLSVDLGGAVGRYLRVEVTQANLNESGVPLTQIGEIEVFGTPAADKSELGSLMKQYVHFGGDTSAELYVTASAAAGDAASRQGYVDLLVKKMTPVVEELEANYVEPPAEEDTQTVTSETEDVTQILAPADTEEPADTDEDSGCGSAIGFGVAGLLTAMAAAVALKKKKD